MQNRFRRGAQPGVSHPFRNVTKSVSTSQGRYTFYAIVICAILGMTLYQPMVFLIQKLTPVASLQNAADLAIIITIVFCAVLLVASLLKMQTITALIENRRLQSFNQRMARRKESNNSDG